MPKKAAASKADMAYCYSWERVIQEEFKYGIAKVIHWVMNMILLNYNADIPLFYFPFLALMAPVFPHVHFVIFFVSTRVGEACAYWETRNLFQRNIRYWKLNKQHKC